MADYIDREAVFKLLKMACDECRDGCEEFDGILPDCNQCIMHGVVEEVPKVPAADVRPVVRGTVVPGNNPFTGECSECGANLNVRWNFCPNCGAEMEDDNG